MWAQIKEIFSNPIFLSGIFSWLFAQFIKTVINLIYGRIHSITELLEYMIWRTGGFPSSHSALVTSLSTTIAFRNGINSDIFMLSMVFLMVTVRDALGVRRSSGVQAKKLNEIGKDLKEKNIIDFTPIKEVNGHTPMEVIFGCLLGFFIGLGFSLL